MDFLTFFGLKEDPFKLTPDPAYFYPSSSHNEGLLLMDYSIDQKEGFLLIIGDPGTGKTTLLKVFMEKWKSRAEIAIVLTPRLSPEEFLVSVAEDLNISPASKNKNEIIKALRDFMLQQSANNKRVIIIVDEAQNLPDETLEELRLLSNLETDKDKLLQIILLGQPELESKLMSDSLRQLNQRIVTRVHLQHFNNEETRDYINFRLIKAGKENLKVHANAVKSIFKYTNGVPRLINMLIARSLMAAFLEESNTILHKHIQHAIKSLNHTDMKLKESNVIVPVMSAAAALCAVSIAAFLYISSSDKVGESTELNIDKPSSEQITAVVSSSVPAADDIVSTVNEASLQKHSSSSAHEPLKVQDPASGNIQALQTHAASTGNDQPAEEVITSAASGPNDNETISTTASSLTANDNEVFTYTAPYKIIAVNVDIAMIRNEPSIISTRAGWSQKGNQFVVLKEFTDVYDTKWYLIPHRGDKHWISAEVVKEIPLNP